MLMHPLVTPADRRSPSWDLQTGWGDTYYQSVGGQSFNITNLPNGQYKVRVTVNPTGELYETMTDNNVTERACLPEGTTGQADRSCFALARNHPMAVRTTWTRGAW